MLCKDLYVSVRAPTQSTACNYSNEPIKQDSASQLQPGSFIYMDIIKFAHD